MNRAITLILMFVSLQSCNKQKLCYVDSPDEQKISLIDIDTVYKTISDDSIKIKIGFKGVPSDSIQYDFLRVEIVFDINNDTIYKDDLSLGFLAFVPDSNNISLKRTLNDILNEGSIKSIFKYKTLIDNGFYFPIKSMHYSGNYLVIEEAKSSFKMLESITDSLNWHVIAIYGDGLPHENYNSTYTDYFSPFYTEIERMK